MRSHLAFVAWLGLLLWASGAGAKGRIDFGEVELSNGRSERLSLDVGNEEGWTLVASADSPAVAVRIGNLRTPHGVSLIAGDEQDDEHWSRSKWSLGTASVMVPQTPDLDRWFVPGRYSFDIEARDPGSGRRWPAPVRVRLTATPTPRGGSEWRRLDVNLFLSGAGGLSAATAPTEPRLQAALNGMNAVYAQAKIQIAKVRYLDVPDAPQRIEANGERLLYQRHTGSAPSGVNIFLVASIRQGTRDYLGWSPLPGAALSAGTWSSGLVIAYERAVAKEGDLLGQIMAHEAAHFLGLYHVVEKNGAEDNLADTPGGGGFRGNLMYHHALPTATLLTAAQVRVLRRNPLVY